MNSSFREVRGVFSARKYTHEQIFFWHGNSYYKELKPGSQFLKYFDALISVGIILEL